MDILTLLSLGVGPAEPARIRVTPAERRAYVIGQAAFWYGPTLLEPGLNPETIAFGMLQEAEDAELAVYGLWDATENGR